MYDFWDYCNAVRRNVLATTLFIAVVRVNETKFLSNLTLSSFSAGLDFGWGGDVCKRGGWKCMCGCWRFLVVRLCCKPGFRGGPGGNRRVGGGWRGALASTSRSAKASSPMTALFYSQPVAGQCLSTGLLYIPLEPWRAHINVLNTHACTYVGIRSKQKHRHKFKSNE